MKNFKSLIPNIKYPKLRLPVLLWIVFLVVILLEGYVLYQSLYVGAERGREPASESQAITPIDFDSYERAIEWIGEKENYQLPDYTLSGQNTGRENPFAEY